MNVGDKVEIKDFTGGRWAWLKRHGHITAIDKRCAEVRTDDGENIRDVLEHFRPKK